MPVVKVTQCSRTKSSTTRIRAKAALLLAGIFVAGTALPASSSSTDNGLIEVDPFPTAVEISPDGDLAYVLHGASGVVSVVDTSSRSRIDTIETGAIEPSGLAFTPDGTQALLAGHADSSNPSTLYFIDVASGTVTETLELATWSNPSDVTISPDGSTAYLVNTGSGSLSTVDIENATVTATVPLGSGSGGAAAISPDGRLLYVPMTWGNDGIVVFDTVDNEIVHTIPINGVSLSAVFSPDGQTVWASVADTGTIIAIDVASNSIADSIQLERAPSQLAITPDGRQLLASAPDSDTVTIIDTGTRDVVSHVAVGRAPWGVAVTPDGASAYVALNTENALALVDLESGTGPTLPSVPEGVRTPNIHSSTVDVGDKPQRVAVSPDGSYAYLVKTDSQYTGTVDIINTAVNEVVVTLTVGQNPNDIAFSPGGELAYVTAGLSGDVTVIDTATQTVSDTIVIPGPGTNGSSYPAGVTFSPDGQSAYVSTSHGSVVVINTATASVETEIPTGLTTLRGIDVSPDGTRVYAASYSSSGAVAVVDVATGNAETISVGGDADDVAVSPDGSKIYVAVPYTYESVAELMPGYIAVIDSATHTVAKRMKTGGYPSSVAFSPGGELAYVPNYYSGTLSVINTQNDTPTAPPITLALGAGPTHVALTPDGYSAYVTDDVNGVVYSLISFGVPGPPVLDAVAGDSEVDLTWVAPEDNGGTEIIDYELEYRPYGSDEWLKTEREPSTDTAFTVTELTNGTEYEFQVAAINSVGTGPPSEPVRATPLGVPGPPVLDAVAGNSEVDLTWVAPEDNGGTEIIDYELEYRPYGSDEWLKTEREPSTDTAFTVTELTNGTEYEFQVAAINSVGTGPPSEPARATPLGPVAPDPAEQPIESPTAPDPSSPAVPESPNALSVTGPEGVGMLVTAGIVLAGLGLALVVYTRKRRSLLS